MFRPFFVNKPSASFFGDSHMTAAVRPAAIEYIFRLKTSGAEEPSTTAKTTTTKTTTTPDAGYGVVNLTVIPSGPLIFANLGDISGDINDILSTIVFDEGEHTLFLDILDGTHPDWQFLCLDLGDGPVSGIGRLLPGYDLPPLQLLGHPGILSLAESLLDTMLGIYRDLTASRHPALRNLTSFFFTEAKILHP